MKGVLKVILCAFAAVFVHALLLLFGGIFFMHGEASASSKRDVELVAEDVEKDAEEKQPEERQPEEPIETKEEPPPDANEMAPTEAPVAGADDGPALDAASLSALEAALNGGAGAAGGMDFGGGAASLQGGGRIGATGRGGAEEKDDFQGAFSMSEIDQRPRAVHQVAAGYPQAMRAARVEGIVTLIFIVDETGRVVNPRVEKSSHPEFEAPALESVRQWRFEPAVKGGQRVGCRMRVPIRFQPPAR
ncbi:MAG: energy transducer TonB [Phycisphaerales bacterium]